jgi:N-methylhydantoinase A
VTRDYSASLLGGRDPAPLLGDLLAQARADLAREGIAEADMAFAPLLDARYRGQAYELTIPYTEDVDAAFHAAHKRAYGHALPGRAVELVNLRVQAVGAMEKPVFTPEPLDENDGASGRIGQKNGMILYAREALTPGAHFAGAALIFQLDSTVYVPDGWTVQVDGYRNLILTAESRGC